MLRQHGTEYGLDRKMAVPHWGAGVCPNSQSLGEGKVPHMEQDVWRCNGEGGGMTTLQSIRRVVCSGTAFFSLKLASMVDSSGGNSIFASSAVLSSNKDSICIHRFPEVPSFPRTQMPPPR